jgi:hypothetical protein
MATKGAESTKTEPLPWIEAFISCNFEPSEPFVAIYFL